MIMRFRERDDLELLRKNSEPRQVALRFVSDPR